MKPQRLSSRQCQVDEKLNDSSGEGYFSWDEIIFDLKNLIIEQEQRLSDLKLAARNFEKRKKAGEPCFPQNLTSESANEDLGQRGDLGQSPTFQPFNLSTFPPFDFRGQAQTWILSSVVAARVA